MSPLILIWLASIIGAGLFFGAGYFARRTPAATAQSDEVPQLQAALQRAEAQVQQMRAVALDTEQAQENLSQLQAEHAQALQELGAGRAAEARLQQSLQELQAQARAPSAEQQALHEQVRALQAQIADERARHAAQQARPKTPLPDLAAQRELQVALARIEELKGVAGSAQGLQQELQELRARVSEEHSALQSRTQEVERENAELERGLMHYEALASEAEALRKAALERDALRMEMQALHQRLEASEAVRSENDRLRMLGVDNDRLRARLQEAEGRVAEFQAMGLMRLPKPEAELPASASSLEDVVRPLASGPNARSTVVADDLGFPIVGYGEHQESLAALCGLLVDLDRNAQRLLPLGGITKITLHAEHGALVSACRWPDADVTLTLATLTAGPGPEPGRLETVLGQLASTLLLNPGRTTDRSNS